LDWLAGLFGWFLTGFFSERRGKKEKKTLIPLKGGNKIRRQSRKIVRQTCICKMKRIPFSNFLFSVKNLAKQLLISK
jgi:hypothetical protein